MKSVQRTEQNTLRYLLIFFIVFVVVIAISATYKVVRVIQESKFNGQVFNLAVIGQEAYIIHINRYDNKISLLEIPNSLMLKYHKETLPYSLLFGVPIHAVVYDTKRSLVMSDFDDFFSFSNSLNISGNPRYKKTGVNIADLIKINMTLSSIPDEKTLKDSIQLADFKPENYGKIDPLLYNLFKNTELINKKISVEVVNATNVNGLGGKFSRIFENSGYDVVSVVSDNKYNKTQIFIHDSDEDINLDLTKIFNIPLRMTSSQQIANITFIIAKDGVNNLGL